MQIGAEMLDALKYGAFERRTSGYEVIPVDPDEVRAYKKWKRKLRKFERIGRAKGWYVDGYSGPEFVKPADKTVPIYAESEQEFYARVDAAYSHHEATGDWPDDTRPYSWYGRI